MQFDQRASEEFAFGNHRFLTSVRKETKKKPPLGLTNWLLVKNQVEEQWGLQTHTEARPSAWMKQQQEVVAAALREAEEAPVQGSYLFALDNRYFSSLTEDIEEQNHAWSHPSVILN